MAIELIDGYLTHLRGGKYYESDVYDDHKNSEAVTVFDRSFQNAILMDLE